ncbi:HlyD family secretion protein [Tropicibacter sp. R16_0]|uniref:HlyD family secretion protein n=1 Tax=Tropicibacter sp. R16_0 TaxID=2821102 RepID=UPI001ADA9952|nr:biotin/lipoyl-binding protein [Tropicibacter sp. R16_0]MBO9453134.1 HlyD family secretion protein [Tropicibacter sp. R16_0]
MLIILGLYFGVIWLVFSKLKLLPWNGFFKSVVYGGALVIALVVIGALNHTTPSGRVSIQGAVVNIAPNVAGHVTEIPVVTNQRVKKDDVLFRIDDTTQVAEVARLEAALSSARASADQLKTDLIAAEADIASLTAQLEFGVNRRDDIIQLADRGASTEFQLQEAVSTIEQLEAGLRSANARKAGLERRIAAQIDGVDVSIVEAQAALTQAQWALDQTTVRAPSDGIVTGLTLRVGNRVTTVQGAVNFLIPDDRKLVATLPQSSAANVAVGDTIRIALGTMPGRHFETVIRDLPPATLEGTLDTRASLPRLRDLAGTSQYTVVMDVPDTLSDVQARLGASGTALVITENAGAIAALAEVLFWIGKMMNYL